MLTRRKREGQADKATETRSDLGGDFDEVNLDDIDLSTHRTLNEVDDPDDDDFDPETDLPDAEAALEEEMRRKKMRTSTGSKKTGHFRRRANIVRFPKRVIARVFQAVTRVAAVSDYPCVFLL